MVKIIIILLQKKSRVLIIRLLKYYAIIIKNNDVTGHPAKVEASSLVLQYLGGKLISRGFEAVVTQGH